MERNYSKIIYELRKGKAMSQYQLAKVVGVTQTAIDFWEKGINEPKASYIVAMAKFFEQPQIKQMLEQLMKGR